MSSDEVTPQIELATADNLGGVEAAAWNALNSNDQPFLSYAFLRGLEQTGCVGGDTGWHPNYLLAYINGRLVGALPMFVKMNSNGEFVYDWSWANAWHQHGVPYYPKLVVAVPFSPVAGERILTAPLPAELRISVRDTLIRGALSLADNHNISGLHWLFLNDEDHNALNALGLTTRFAFQYHWYNRNYAGFDDFAAQLRSKKRRALKRERRLVAEAGVTMRTKSGGELTDEERSALFRFYRNTCNKFYYGNQYLNRDFFEHLFDSIADQILAVLAYKQNKAVAGALCLRDNTRVYGRYWGADEDIDCLHFETCFYTPIDYTGEHKLKVIEPGAGGEHKYARGFEPTITRSCHWIGHPQLGEAVHDFCEREAEAVKTEVQRLRRESPYKEMP